MEFFLLDFQLILLSLNCVGFPYSKKARLMYLCIRLMWKPTWNLRGIAVFFISWKWKHWQCGRCQISCNFYSATSMSDMQYSLHWHCGRCQISFNFYCATSMSDMQYSLAKKLSMLPTSDHMFVTSCSAHYINTVMTLLRVKVHYC